MLDTNRYKTFNFAACRLVLGIIESYYLFFVNSFCINMFLFFTRYSASVDFQWAIDSFPQFDSSEQFCILEAVVDNVIDLSGFLSETIELGLGDRIKC